LSSGVHALTVNNFDVAVVDLNGTTPPTAAQLIVFQCNSVTCVETFGYLKIVDSYYKVDTDFVGAELTTNTGIGQVDSGHELNLGDGKKIGFASDESVNYYLLKGVLADSVLGTSGDTVREIIVVGKHFIVENKIYTGKLRIYLFKLLLMIVKGKRKVYFNLFYYIFFIINIRIGYFLWNN